MKRRFKHSCFPVNIAKCLRTAFLIEHLRISPYSVRMWENADHDNFECGKFLRSGGQKISNRKCKKISNRHNLGRHFVTKCMCLFYFFMFLSVFLIFFGSFAVSYINNIILITIFIEWYKRFGKYNFFKLLKFSTIQNNSAISQFVRFFKDFSQLCLKTLVYQNMQSYTRLICDIIKMVSLECQCDLLKRKC